MNETHPQSVIDEEHLRLLRIGYFISGGFAAFIAVFGLFYAAFGLFIGVMASRATTSQASGPPPEEVGWIFAVFGVAFTLFAGTVAGLKLRVARCLRERRSRGLCLVMAAVSCVEMPYGTALGIFTFMTLSRPSVRRLFSETETTPGRG